MNKKLKDICGYLFIILVIVAIGLFVINKFKGFNDSIDYDFSSENMVMISDYVELDKLEDSYTTYIEINTDGTCSMEMWPRDEKPNIDQPKVVFNIDSNSVRELADVCNRYKIKDNNSIDVVGIENAKNIIIEYTANGKIYKFTNYISDNNFDYVVNYIKTSLIDEKIMNEYLEKVDEYINK